MADGLVRYGKDGNDTIVGSEGDDRLYGLGGDDSLSGSEGNDGIRGGAGNDWIEGGAGNDALFGEDGNDTITGSSYDRSRIDGGEGNDRLFGLGQLYGGGGDDELTGGGTLSGGDGNDVIILNGTQYDGEAETRIDYAMGGAGDDTISANTQNYTFSSEKFRLAGGEGDNLINLRSTSETGAYEAQILAGSGNDTVDALVTGTGYSPGVYSTTFYVDLGAGDNVVKIEARPVVTANITIATGDGADTITAIARPTIDTDAATNTVRSNGGDDLIDATAITSGYYGRLGSNFISAGTGNDTINAYAAAGGNASGGRGENLIAAGDGDDRITLFQGGNSTLQADVSAGTGADTISSTTYLNGSLLPHSGTIHVRGGDGCDVITSVVSTEDTNQVMNFLEGDAGDDMLTATIQLRAQGGQAVDSVMNRLYGGAGNDTIEAAIDSNNAPGSEVGTHRLYGGAGDDVIEAAGGFGNQLFGDEGSDRIGGSANADGISGGTGNDTIQGNGGADVLHGDAGDDVIDGGDGNDLFLFSVASGNDIIADFGTGDVLRLQGQTYKLAMASDGSTILDLSGGGTITLTGIPVADFDPAAIA